MKNTLPRVVITGLGCITPIGNDINVYWDALIKGTSGAGLITRFDASQHKTKFACEVKGYNPENFFERKEARKLDLYTQFGLVAATQAMEDSGLNTETLDKFKAGVIWASGIGGIATFEDECTSFVKGNFVPRFSPFFIPKMIADMCAGQISIKYGFCGPNFATVSACASSSHAISDAFNMIRLGKADVMITGGSEASVCAAGVGGFNSMQALSTRNDDFLTASRPFDKDRDGFVIGEGGAGLVLENYEHAKARGAKIYAEIVGCGLTADAYHITAPHPDGLGAMMAMKYALEEGGVDFSEVDHINTHGTSTPIGDIAEPKAIVSLFGDHAKSISINSTKSMTGHLLGAAGAVEAIATVLAVKNDIVPPTINHFTDDPNVPDLDYTFGTAKHRTVNVALSNTFGFGGHNACMAIKKYNE